jgi:FMN phosphatase YigB (HAD superfamily)
MDSNRSLSDEDYSPRRKDNMPEMPEDHSLRNNSPLTGIMTRGQWEKWQEEQKRRDKEREYQEYVEEQERLNLENEMINSPEYLEALREWEERNAMQERQKDWKEQNLTPGPDGTKYLTLKSGGKVKKKKSGGKVYSSHDKRYSHGGKVSGRKAKYNG